MAVKLVSGLTLLGLNRQTANKFNFCHHMLGLIYKMASSEKLMEK